MFFFPLSSMCFLKMMTNTRNTTQMITCVPHRMKSWYRGERLTHAPSLLLIMSKFMLKGSETIVATVKKKLMPEAVRVSVQGAQAHAAMDKASTAIWKKA